MNILNTVKIEQSKRTGRKYDVKSYTQSDHGQTIVLQQSNAGHVNLLEKYEMKQQRKHKRTCIHTKQNAQHKKKKRNVTFISSYL